MKNNLQVFSEVNMPPEVRKVFDSIIEDGITVFAKNNDISKEKAYSLFADKLSNISFQTYDPEKLDIKKPEDRELMSVTGLTRAKIEDTSNIDSKISRTIYLNKTSLGEDEIKSTLIHEIYHGVMADNNLKQRNRENVYNMGAHEVVFQDGQVISNVGSMLHEAEVARMEKQFCKKHGIEFVEQGLFASGYKEEMKILEEIENVAGIRMLPTDSLEMKKIKHGNIIGDLAVRLDRGDIVGCEKIIDSLLTEKIKDPSTSIFSKISLIAKKAKRMITKKDKDIGNNATMVLPEKKGKSFLETLQSRVETEPKYTGIEKDTKTRQKQINQLSNGNILE